MKTRNNVTEAVNSSLNLISGKDYKTNHDKSNILIQKALSETDLDSVISICNTLGEDREIITFNLSESVRKLVEAEIKEKEGSAKASSEAMFSFEKKLIKYHLKSDELSDLEIVDNISIETDKELKSSLLSIHKLNRTNNLQELSDLILTTQNKDIKKELLLVLQGYDPLRAENIIEKINQRLITQYTTKLNKLKDSIVSILSDESIEELADILDV